jgi:hypothetical protein
MADINYTGVSRGNTSRPDELASQSEIQRNDRLKGNLKKGASAILGTGASFLGAGLTSKILPLLSEYIPTDLAIKGISKVSPMIGDFLKKGQRFGLDPKEGLKFVRDQIEKPEQQVKENRNIIQQYSPELHQFIEDQIKKGVSPIDAGSFALSKEGLGNKFNKVIKQIEKDHQTDWSSILQSVYGTAEQPQKQEQQQVEQPKPQQMQAQPGQGQPGQGQAALMAIMQKINQKLGK